MFRFFLDTNKDVSNVLKQVMESDSDSSDEVCGCFICLWQLKSQKMILFPKESESEKFCKEPEKNWQKSRELEKFYERVGVGEIFDEKSEIKVKRS